MQHFRQKLIDERAALVETHAATREASETVELDQARVGRLSRMDAMQAQQMALETIRRNQKRLRDIESALQRMDDDDFGECSECGEGIDPRRLAVNPATQFCIDCAE